MKQFGRVLSALLAPRGTIFHKYWSRPSLPSLFLSLVFGTLFGIIALVLLPSKTISARPGFVNASADAPPLTELRALLQSAEPTTSVLLVTPTTPEKPDKLFSSEL